MNHSSNARSSGSILMNFRIPTTLKANFQAICQQQHISMTARLNLMVREFVESEIPSRRQISR